MNNQEDEKNTIEKSLSDKIKNGDIKMKPKAYFVVRTALLIAAIVVVFLFLIYLISFIIFSLHTSGVWFLPIFGFHAIGILFSSLPWWLIILSIGLIIILELFAERLSFVHHRPVVYSLIVIIVIVLLASIFIAVTPFHSDLFESAYDQHLPIIGSFYRDYGTPQIHNVHNGVITKLTDSGVIIETPNGEQLTVIFDTQDISSLLPMLKVGNALVVVGEKNGNTIQASDIRKIQEDMSLFPSHRLHSHSL